MDQEPDDRGIDAFIAFATAHGETSDTRQVIGDLSDMLRAAWRLMTPAQRAEFRGDADVLGIVEAAGGSGVGANG
jgi:hypothetical protein